MVVVIMPNRAAYDAYLPVPKEMAAYYNIMTNRSRDVRGSRAVGGGP